MIVLRNILLAIIGLTALIGAVLWAGLQVKPQPFPPYAEKPSAIDAIPLPDGLPGPVERFYRTVYGDEIPRIETVVIQGRGVIKPFMKIPIPARFLFVHKAGHEYRHYFEGTLFGIPLMKVNEGYLDGESYFESPMGSYYDDANSNQGANLALWAEAIWFPSLWLTDGRVRWQALDDHSAVLVVPFGEDEESILVRFNPETGLIDMLEAMRYRDPGEGRPKILWIAHPEGAQVFPGTRLVSAGSVMWLDQGQPWAYFTLEELVYNTDVSAFIRQRGR